MKAVYFAAGEPAMVTQVLEGTEPAPLPGFELKLVDDAASVGDLYLRNGTIKTRPAPPGDNYRFDIALERWVYDTAPAAEAAREQRARLLLASDWTQLPDVPLTTKTLWAAYRQALRDVTAQPGFPTEVTWPTPPT